MYERVPIEPGITPSWPARAEIAPFRRRCRYRLLGKVLADDQRVGRSRMASKRLLGVEYFIKALSSGERSAAQRLEPFLADDVELDTNSQPGVPPIGREVFSGKDVVFERVSGQWPATPGYGRLGWSEPFPDGDGLKVISSGAVTLSFSFNELDQIRRVYLDGGWGSGLTPPPVVAGPVEEIPLFLRGLINHARANQTPMIVTYVDEHGVPRSSFRGSTQVIGPTTLGIWVRDANGGLAKAIVTNPAVSLVYADLRGSGMIMVSGRASVSDSEETRRKIYEGADEAEQTHDIERKGAALVVEVASLQAFAGGNAFSIQRA